MSLDTPRKIAILGGGAWGLALGKLLLENGHHVRIWEYNPEYVQLINSTHTNPYLLKDVVLPDELLVTNIMEEAWTTDIHYVITAVPSQFLRSSLMKMEITPHHLSSLVGLINVAKGIEETSLKRMSQLIAEAIPALTMNKFMCLSGPSHAEEVARHIPTAVVLAGSDDAMLVEVQNLLSNAYFRVYRSHDLIGVEIGGTVKNIIAIAAGIVDGLGFGDNTKGALLTRGIAEISRLGLRMGAKQETFLGLSGMGDLITTAISTHSRNRYVGYEIGRGRKLQDILAGMKAIAEGVTSTKSVYELKHQYGVEMPIIEAIFQVLFQDKPALEAINELMNRSLKEEV